MHGKNNLIWKKGLILSLLVLMIGSLLVGIPNGTLANSENNSKQSLPDYISFEQAQQLADQFGGGNNGEEFSSIEQQLVNPNLDLARLLADNPNEYQQTYQPWKSQAAVRCITLSDDYEYMAVGGGYLYDNEVQIYRWNPSINQYAKVWVSGDTAIKGDVIDVDFGDTDNNDFLEIVAASADGYFYVFEQEHIFDPVTNTENRFDLVYTSPYLGQVWGVEVNDTDLDHQDDIIVVSWDHKVHVYEYWLHSGYPFNEEHWITYREKWQSHDTGYHLTSLVVGDTNYNGLPDFVVGTREGAILIFENNGTILNIQGQPYPLAQDNSYKLIYTDSENIWRPIYSMDIGNLDNSPGDEVVIASFAFNGYILRYDNYKGYYLQKLIKDFESWTLKDFYPADHFVDNGSAGQNVYFRDPNYVDNSVPEPILQSNPAFIKGNYPYNTGAAQDNNTCYTHFVSNSTHSAWEVYDFGADEEGTGNSNEEPDILLKFKTGLFEYLDIDDFIITISPDYEHWVEVDSSLISAYGVFTTMKYLKINVDPILIEQKWNYFRYINVTVIANASDTYDLVSIELPYVYQTVSTALSAEVGTLITSNSVNDEVIHAILGTVDGRLVAFKYDETSDSFVLSWDSWVDDRFTMGINIWDIEQAKTIGAMPMIYGLTNLDTDYLLKPSNQPVSQIPGVIVDYTLTNIDGDSPQTGEFVMANNLGDVYYFDKNFQYDSALTTQYFTDINGYGKYTENISVAAVEIDSDYDNEELLIGYYDASLSNQYDDFYDDSTDVLPADIEIWHQSASSYALQGSLYDLETTGQLREILKSAQSIPSAEGEDIDGDGDTDIVVCINNLYLLWNIGDDANPEYVIDSDYFEDINEVRGRRQFFHPQFVEFTQNGVYELSIGYSNRVGATYFDNIGTALAPKWEEKKELVNNFDEEATINVYNFTRPLWIKWDDFDEYSALYLEHETGDNYLGRYYFFTMIDDRDGEFVQFLISNKIQTSFMVASNPAVSRIEVNTFKSVEVNGIYKYRNFGFRAIVSWSTITDLFNWTLTVDSGDLDQDGKGEIIVGDYDSNIYIFEHLTNNTYKRAFRSPDMIQYIPTSDTPYAWDQFGGFEGEFNQTVWNHVSYIVINADSDHDGYLELAALAGTVLYIFEDTGIDDTYSYMYRFDLLRSSSGDYLKEQGYLTPSGLTWAEDLDLDGYGEFIVAFEQQVFVYEPYSGKLYELFGNVASDDPSTGHYNLIGNGLVVNNITINGMLCADTNENGKDELFIYGSVDVDQLDYEEGFIVMIESKGLGYQVIWQGPSELVSRNVIYDLQIGDNDYDGFQELFIAGSKGVSIWEFTGGATTDYEQQGLLTGHMNYPQMDGHSLFGKYSYNSDYDYRKQRSHDVRQIIYSGTNNHSFIAMFSEYDTDLSAYAIYQKVSQDGITWHSKQLVVPPIYSGSQYRSVYFPSLTQTLNYSLWMTVIKSISVGFALYSINLYRSDDYGASWTSVATLAEVETFSGGSPIYSPTIFPTGSNSIGLLYIVRNSTHQLLYHGGIESDGSVITPSIVEGFDDFEFNGVDADSKPNGYYDTIAVALSAKKTIDDKDDYDIWYCELNSTYGITLEPRKLFTSYAVEHTPSISYVHNDAYSLLLSFDSAGLQKATTLSYGMVSDDGVHWSDPDIIAEYPEYVIPPSNSVPYPKVSGFDSSYHISGIGFRAPKIAPTYDGRFIALTKFDATLIRIVGAIMYVYYYNDYISQIYPLNFTSFIGLNKATDIAIGDSDRDGRKEILIADGDQAKLFELVNTKDQKHLYTSKWFSPEHDNPVTDVTMFDTNENGFPELIYSVQGEDVYVYDITNIHLPKANINKLKASSISLTGVGDVVSKVKTDLNGDGLNDFVVYYDNGKMYAILNNFTVLWTMEGIDVANNYYLDESIYEGQNALIFVASNGTTLWINKTIGGIIDTVNLETGGNNLYPIATMLNYTSDNTLDLAIRTHSSNEIYIFDCHNGSLVASIDYSGKSVQDLKVAHSRGHDYLIVLYTYYETIDLGFIILYLYYNNVSAYNLSTSDLTQIWEYRYFIGIVNVGALLQIDDIDANGEQEIFLVSRAVALIDPNGTEIWETNNIYGSMDAIVYDVNHDGIKDIIASSGHNAKVTAYDGRDGNITWSNVPTGDMFSGIVDLDISNPEEENATLYLACSAAGYEGVIFLDASNGGFMGYYYDENIDFQPEHALIGTTVDSEPAVLALDYDAAKIYRIQINKTKPELTHDQIPKLLFEQTLQAGKNINPDTILYGYFNDDDEEDIFYIKNGNESVIYTPSKGEVLMDFIIPTNDSIRCAIPINQSDERYYDSIFIITEANEVGILYPKDESYSKLDLEGLTAGAYEIYAWGYADTSSDHIILGYYDEIKKDMYVGAWDPKGTRLFTPFTTTDQPAQIIAGHLLYNSGDDGYAFIVRSINGYVKGYKLDGTMIDNVGEGVKFVDIGHYKKGSYDLVYFQVGEVLRCYSLEDQSNVWQYTLNNDNLILSLTTGYLDSAQDYSMVFITQNGTGIYAFDNENPTTEKWFYRHNSFVANYLHVINDEKYGTVLQVTDYHRTFYINGTTSDVLYATTSMFNQVLWVGTLPSYNTGFDTLVFYDGQSFYSRGIKLSQSSSSSIDDLPFSYERLTSLSTPLFIMMGIMVTMVVIVVRKNR